MLSHLEVVPPAELSVGELLGGVGQAAAEHRLGAETVLLALVGEYVLKGVEFLGNILYLLGDTGRALGIKVRADVYDNHLLNLLGIAAGEGHAVASAHGMADQDKRVQSNGLAETFQVCYEGLARVISTGSPVALAPASLVQRQHMVVLAELGGNVVPRVAMPTQAMK